MDERAAPLTTPGTHRRAATARAVAALMLREMSASYGRSPGGYAWAVLEPLAGIALLTLIFMASGLRAPPLGTSFALFYASGLLPVLTFTTITGKLMSALNYSKALLSYPAITYVDALLARFALAVLTQLMVSVVLLAAILLATETKATVTLPSLFATYGLTFLLALGVGTLNCALASLFPVWQSVWSILARPLILVSCVFFVFEDVPHPFDGWLWWNPLVHVVGLMRKGLFAGYAASYVTPLLVVIIGAVTCLAGLVVLHRYARDILYQ